MIAFNYSVVHKTCNCIMMTKFSHRAKKRIFMQQDKSHLSLLSRRVLVQKLCRSHWFNWLTPILLIHWINCSKCVKICKKSYENWWLYEDLCICKPDQNLSRNDPIITSMFPCLEFVMSCSIETVPRIKHVGGQWTETGRINKSI